MSAITIRKLSETASANIKLQAKANGRSAEAEARLALEQRFAGSKKVKSALEVIEEFKRRNGGGIDLPYMTRSTDPIEPADFE
jgi:plasmid stability protein